MPQYKSALDLVVLLHREMKPQLNSDENWQGILPEDFNFDEVQQCLAGHDLDGLNCDTENRKLEFSVPPHFYTSITAMLRSPQQRLNVPERFYLADLAYLHPNDAEQMPQIVKNYLDAVQCFKNLESIADDVRSLGADKVLVFLGQKKLEITSAYEEAELVDLVSLSEFENEFITSNTHQQQKKTILHSVLFNLFSGQQKTTFGLVLKKYSELLKQSESSYQLYVSEFSFQKIKDEVEREKLEFITRLNKVFSDIQNQLLAIPAALVLVGGQMRPAESITLSNLLVWLGALVFAILMSLLIRNQHHTLAAVKHEINRQIDLIRYKHQQVAGQFEDSYDDLNHRFKHQKYLLNTVSVLVSISLLLATFLLAKYSKLLYF